VTAGDRRHAPPPRWPAIVLASASPRRRELLAALGLPFAVRPVDLDETPRPGEAPRAYVARLAVEKAAAADSHHGELVLAADTVVVLPGEGEDGGPALLGKPADPAEAEAMLARLAGREHVVFTGVALVGGGDGAAGGGRRAVAIEESRVRIAPLGPDEIAWYVATGEPLDKAGAYAIQGIGALFVEAVEGNYSNVVGLPLPAVSRLFRELGYDLTDFLALPATG
jgi:septum formation protein